MGNAIAALVGLAMLVLGAGFAGFILTVGPSGPATIALAAGLGGVVGGAGLLALYLGLTKDDWQEGDTRVTVGGPRR